MKKVFPLAVKEVIDLLISGQAKLAHELVKEAREAEREYEALTETYD